MTNFIMMPITTFLSIFCGLLHNHFVGTLRDIASILVSRLTRNFIRIYLVERYSM